jgi:preprotein translocase subunit YajC
MISKFDKILFSSLSLAQATPAPQPFWAQMVPFVLIIAIFYFVLIRPQMKAKKDQETLISLAKTGDKIVTTGGIIGTIANVKESSVMIKVADNVKIEVLKNHIASITKSDAKPETASTVSKS